MTSYRTKADLDLKVTRTLAKQAHITRFVQQHCTCNLLYSVTRRPPSLNRTRCSTKSLLKRHDAVRGLSNQVRGHYKPWSIHSECLLETTEVHGTAADPLLQGISYSLSALSLPSLLSLPSAKPAQHAFVALQQSATLQLRTLAGVSMLSLSLAYALSPSLVRHPYLLWTSLFAAFGASTDLLLGQAPFADEQDVNGETVERAVRNTQLTEAVRAGVGAVAFSMAVVGLWGDGA